MATTLAQAELRAGAAKVEITPDLTKFTVPLGGYAARRDAPAKGVETPLFARAVVLSQGDTRMGIVSLDLCFLPRSIKEAVAKCLQERQSKIQGNSLFLSATHTHTAPDPLAMHRGNQFPEIKHFTRFNPDLLSFVAERIAEALLRAEANMAPATAASLTESVPNLNRNRRGDPTIDREMTVLRITTMQGKQIASVVNFAAHPTLYDDNMMEFSPDYPGILTAQVESTMGGICLFLNGAEGDATTLNAKGATPKERISTYGGLVAEAAQGLLGRATPDTDPKLRIWTTPLSLPPRKPNGWFVLAAAQLGATLEQAKALVRGMMPESSTVTFAQIGELLLMGVPCEPTGDIGVEAKARAKKQGFGRPAIVALTNDWLSYCVTAKQYKAGNYEASMCFYGDGFGEALLSGISTGLTQGTKP
jgi:hypothetical protein